MVKVIGPLGSLSARGRVGAIVYQTGLYGQFVRGHFPQKGIASDDQFDWRLAFGITADNWRLLEEEEKEEWDILAKGRRMTGFNLYIKENIHDNLP